MAASKSALDKRFLANDMMIFRNLHSYLRGHNRQLGQALTELAIVVVVILLILGGLFEFGWAFFHYLAMQDAAGEGAAYGIIHPDWHDSGDNADPDNIAYRAKHESESEILDWSDAKVDVIAPFLTPGNLITVTVTVSHGLVTPLLTPFFGDTITLRATAVQRIVSPFTPTVELRPINEPPTTVAFFDSTPPALSTFSANLTSFLWAPVFGRDMGGTVFGQYQHR